MYPHHYVLGLIIAIFSIAVLAGNDSQTLKLTVPKVTLVNVEPITSLAFAQGKTTLSGITALSISSNDPQAKLQITPSGISLTVTSSSIHCPATSSTSPLLCTVGVNRIQGSELAFEATRTGGDDLSIAYTLTQ